MVSFPFESATNSDQLTNQQQQQHSQTQIGSTSYIPDSTPPINPSLSTSFPSRPLSPQPDSPATPPPTPISPSLSHPPTLESSQLMLELTRAKLERAAQGQLTGRRAAGLRELVLLSNAFVGALAPDWAKREREREVAEQRKAEEERWLDGILEEMSVEDEDDEDEAYLEISYRDDREAHDSGFLDQEDDHNERKEPRASTSSLEAIPEDGDMVNSLNSIEDDYMEGRQEVPSEPETASDELTAEQPVQESTPDAPAPSRSPPIPVPISPTRPHCIVQHTDDYSSSASPPQNPPPLTPDCSPRDQPSELLASSLDSFELPDRYGLDRLDWLHHNGHKRQGLFSVPASASPGPDRSSLARLELDTSASEGLQLDSLSRSSSQEDDDQFADHILRSSIVPRSATTSPAPQWVPSTPARSLSLPPPSRARIAPATPHPIPSFQSGIVTLWDCVDFGRQAPPIPYFLPGGQDRAKSLPSSPERGRGAIEGPAGTSVRPLPEFPPLMEGGEEDRTGRSPWRARSMSPEVVGRRPWMSMGGLGGD